MRIAMVAGEASGDLLASRLIRALQARVPGATFCGIGGPRMQAEGFDSWWPAEKLAVMGYADAIKRLPELLRIRRGLLARLQDNPPDIFIGVDAPDFTLGVEARLRRRGVRTMHYVSPSIWAWRGRRVHKIGRSTDHILCLFPFEPALYAKHNIAASFVGHPLADEFPMRSDAAAMRETLQLPADVPVVAVLPGSREGEVGRLADCFIAAIRLIAQKRPEAIFLVPLVTRATRDLFLRALHAAGAQDLAVRCLFGHSHEAMVAADVVLVASGTASLEAALLKRPMVISYRTGNFMFRLAKWMAYLPYVGLPNILAGEFIVPELLQDAATPQALADAVDHWLADTDACARVVERFDQIHTSLRQNNGERAAAAVLAAVGGARRV